MIEQAPLRPRYQWHPDVHHNWGGEHLYFWRLSFHAGFDAAAILGVLSDVLEKAKVRSYAAREMIGTVDIVLRTWLPMSISAPDFREMLFQDLQAVNLGLIDSFDVTSIKSHWSWASGAPRRLRDFEPLASVEDALPALAGSSRPDATAAALEHGGVIIRTGRDQGITFVMAIEGEVERLEVADRSRLSNLLARISESSEKVAEPVLYEGSGFAAYLLLGRVDANEINEVSKLGSNIMESAREEGFPIKTTTMLSHPLEVLLYQEGLPVKAERSASSASNLEEMLRLGEDALTEIREAVFNARPGADDSTPTADMDLKMAASFLNTVASFLNSRGGVVILGAAPVSEWVADGGTLDGVPLIGEYACVGLEADLGKGEWNDYERRLENLLEVHVEPSPMEWIEIDHEYLGGRLMVTVRVLEPDDGFFFFVGDASQSAETFFVRRGSTTIELNQSDADAYRRIDSAKGRLNATDWSIVRALRQQRRLDRFQLASSVGMSAADTDDALERLIGGGYIARSEGADEIPRFELNPHWSDAGASRQRQKDSAF